MAIAVNINVADSATPAMQQLLGMLGGREREDLNRIGAAAAVEGAKDYHRKFDAAGGWFNHSLPTWGPGRKRTQWPRDVSRAWATGSVDASRAVVLNDHPHYRHKVYGGTIRGNPWLTIPIDPRAHGRTTRQFERVTGFKLFKPKGKDVLMFVERKGTPPKTAYVLRRSVTHGRWPGALPVDDVFLEPFIKAMAREIERAL
jgi:hypothetical protein